MLRQLWRHIGWRQSRLRLCALGEPTTSSDHIERPVIECNGLSRRQAEQKTATQLPVFHLSLFSNTPYIYNVERSCLGDVINQPVATRKCHTFFIKLLWKINNAITVGNTCIVISATPGLLTISSFFRYSICGTLNVVSRRFIYCKKIRVHINVPTSDHVNLMYCAQNCKKNFSFLNFG